MTPDALDALRERHVAAHAPALRRVLDREGRALVAAVAGGRDPAAALDPEPLLDALVDLWAVVVAEAGAATFAALDPTAKRDPRPPDWREVAEAFVRRHAGRLVARISDTTLGLVRDAVALGADNGWNPRRTARHLRERWPEVSAVRSERIARTEAVRAATHGQLTGAQAIAEGTGLDLVKVWVATGDGRTRDNHAAVDGQRRPLMDPFDVGGYAADGPGDAALPASESVGCRCAVSFEVAEPATRTARRNAAIRAAYPALKGDHGAEVAFDLLGETHHLSPHTVRDIVYQRGAYAA